MKTNIMKSIVTLTFCLVFNTIFSQNYQVCQNMPSSKNWTIIWGGKPSSSYGASFMEKQTRYSFEFENVLYADYQADIDFCKLIIKGFCKDFQIVSVYGFSRGGVNAYNMIGQVPFVGLIDPLIPSSYKLDFTGSKVFMLYNLGIWDKTNQVRLTKVSEVLGTNGCKRLYMPHLDIPKLFFEKYKLGK